MQDSDGNILEKVLPSNRIANADQAALLIDGANYYGALRRCLLEAQRSVFLVGWDIDSRTRLVGPSGEPDDDLPAELGAFLTELVKRRPELQIKILLWDYSILYAAERELLPQVNLNWMTPKQISICLDDQLPFGSSHHGKCVVIDDALAFLGGIDLTLRRWDTSDHELENEKRVDAAGKPYRPFHDLQIAFDGEAAQVLAHLVRERWRRAACESPPSIDPIGNPWPAETKADFKDVTIGLALTVPAQPGVTELREVETLYCAEIKAARKWVYIESQYLTASAIAAALAESLRANPALEVVIVGPNVAFSWLEENSMNIGRRRFMKSLQDAGVDDRVRLLYPAIPGDDSDQGTMVHAKCMIVDDRFLHVGSANLNNRSMGTDTENDCVIEAKIPEERAAIDSLRNRLLAEHLGVESAAVREATETHESLFAAIDSLSDGERTLLPIEWEAPTEDEVAADAVRQVADPERPIPQKTFIEDFVETGHTHSSSLRVTKLIAVAVAILGFIAVWRYTPLAELVDPEYLVGKAQDLAGSAAMPFVIMVTFVLGGLVAFPVTVLIAATGVLFAPLPAFGLALASSILSAGITFAIGRRLGKEPLRTFIGPRLNRIDRTLAQRGILSVAVLRMLPIAPFTLINVVAGASSVRLADFLLGSLLGMAPGILVLSFLGHQFAAVLADPQPWHLLMFVAGLLAWLALGICFQYLAKKIRAARDE